MKRFLLKTIMSRSQNCWVLTQFPAKRFALNFGLNILFFCFFSKCDHWIFHIVLLHCCITCINWQLIVLFFQILLKSGPYGFYVQHGEDRKGFVPKRASVSHVCKFFFCWHFGTKNPGFLQIFVVLDPKDVIFVSFMFHANLIIPFGSINRHAPCLFFFLCLILSSRFSYMHTLFSTNLIKWSSYKKVIIWSQIW